jgi:hypothetical protein
VHAVYINISKNSNLSPRNYIILEGKSITTYTIDKKNVFLDFKKAFDTVGYPIAYNNLTSIVGSQVI